MDKINKINKINNIKGMMSSVSNNPITGSKNTNPELSKEVNTPKISKPSQSDVLNECCRIIYSAVSSSGIKENIAKTDPSRIINDIINTNQIKAIVWDSIRLYLSKNILTEYTVQHTLIRSIFENDRSEAGQTIFDKLIEEIQKINTRNGNNQQVMNKVDTVKQTEIVFKNFVNNLKGKLYISSEKNMDEKFEKSTDRSFFSLKSLAASTPFYKLIDQELDNSAEINIIFKKYKDKNDLKSLSKDEKDTLLKIDIPKLKEYYQKYKNTVGANKTSNIGKFTNVGNYPITIFDYYSVCNYNYQLFLGNFIELYLKVNAMEGKDCGTGTGTITGNISLKDFDFVNEDVVNKYVDELLQTDIIKHIKDKYVKTPCEICSKENNKECIECINKKY